MAVVVDGASQTTMLNSKNYELLCNHTYVLVGVKVAKVSREFSVEFNHLKPQRLLVCACIFNIK